MNTATTPSKREQTRLRVVVAAIDCIYAVGFNAAHTNRIAEEAGVSWGVLQYHFGDKDGLLQAVLDYIFTDFSDSLAGANLAGSDVRERVSEVIQLVWSLVSRKEYRVTMAILRNAGKDRSSSINGQKQVVAWSQRVTELWNSLFHGDEPPPARSDVARKILFAALRGMADEINPSSRKADDIQAELDALADSVTYLLAT